MKKKVFVYKKNYVLFCVCVYVCKCKNINILKGIKSTSKKARKKGKAKMRYIYL